MNLEMLRSSELSPPIGPKAPPKIDSSDMPPPMIGPIASDFTRWPSMMPTAAKGISEIRISRVISTQRPIGIRTPRHTPATYNRAIVQLAVT